MTHTELFVQLGIAIDQVKDRKLKAKLDKFINNVVIESFEEPSSVKAAISEAELKYKSMLEKLSNTADPEILEWLMNNGLRSFMPNPEIDYLVRLMLVNWLLRNTPMVAGYDAMVQITDKVTAELNSVRFSKSLTSHVAQAMHSDPTVHTIRTLLKSLNGNLLCTNRSKIKSSIEEVKNGKY